MIAPFSKQLIASGGQDKVSARNNAWRSVAQKRWRMNSLSDWTDGQ